MEKHVCPWWLGYFLISPVRKFMHNPSKIVEPYVKPGMKVIDFGPGMGYFTLPMAKMVGNIGKVYCFDIQEKMLSKLMQRAKKAGVDKIIQPYLIKNDNNVFDNLNQEADFALLFAVAHEVPDRDALFSNLHKMLKNGGLLLFSEPSGHVNVKDFEASVSLAQKAGFKVKSQVKVSRSHSVLLEK